MSRSTLPTLALASDATTEDAEVGSAAQYSFSGHDAEIRAGRAVIRIILEPGSDSPLALVLRRCVDRTYRAADPTSAAWFAMADRDVASKFSKLCPIVRVRRPMDHAAAYLLLSRHSREPNSGSLALNVSGPTFAHATFLSVGFSLNPNENLWHVARADSSNLVLVGAGHSQASQAPLGLAHPIGAFLQQG